jgi:NAD+ synthase (glutamine-hydrolysing)
MAKLKIALFQFNPLVGDFANNTNKLIAAVLAAKDAGANLFIAPELAICGYPAEDLLLRPVFYAQAKLHLDRFLAISGITMVIGCPHAVADKHFNSLFVIHDGQIVDRYDKVILPNSSVFDECRYFTPGIKSVVINCSGIAVGLIICEDMWHTAPVLAVQQQGAELVCVINASPFEVSKYDKRLAVARSRVAESGLPLVYVNQVGGQDELVFDGASFILAQDGEVVLQMPAFTEELAYYDYTQHQPLLPAAPLQVYPDYEERLYKALVLAVHDYVAKNGFNGVVLGLSGGIDSALTLAIAVDALGKDKVMAVMMPSLYTADISLFDARDMINRLGVRYEEIEIQPIFNQFKQQLAPTFTGLAENTAEENLQARIRGSLLMAISNKFGYLVLTTGNKSEMATGYATLYGDMAGGFAVLKDVLKTVVYQLSKWRNSQSAIIPQRIIARAPSAELRANQTDQDSLPEYAVLDQIIQLLVEENLSTTQIINQGIDSDSVYQVAHLLKINEYKRRQAAVGPRLTATAFAKDWRYPITNCYKF